MNYVHMIIDCWDYKDPLGTELVELAQRYNETQCLSNRSSAIKTADSGM